MKHILEPRVEEVRQWLLDTTRHVFHIEYFLHNLGLGDNDPQRPHDIIGDGNKFEWEVIKGFALQYRNPKPDFQTYIMPALERHRVQYHHQKWNNPDSKDSAKPILGATPDDMKVGATDAVCSLLENRGYQGGSHTYDSVVEVTKGNPPHKVQWMLDVIPEMKKLKQPEIHEIISLEGIPNIGVEKQTYDIIIARLDETLALLRSDPAFRDLR
jgi:hypothetical protein